MILNQHFYPKSARIVSSPPAALVRISEPNERIQRTLMTSDVNAHFATVANSRNFSPLSGIGALAKVTPDILIKKKKTDQYILCLNKKIRA